MSITPLAGSAQPCPHEAAQLLPWYLNGSLSEADQHRVAAHVERCPACRTELDFESRTRGLLRAPAPVEHAPHAGWQKLLARVDAAEQAAIEPVSLPVPAAAPAAGPGEGLRPRSRPPLVHWLALVVVLQALGLLALAASTLGRPGSGDASVPQASYRTYSSPGTPAASAPPLLRVVFAPSMTLAEVQSLLQAQRLRAVAGPSEAGLFTLALGADAAAAERDAVLGRLRSDPRVRFAEALDAEPAPR